MNNEPALGWQNQQRQRGERMNRRDIGVITVAIVMSFVTGCAGRIEVRPAPWLEGKTVQVVPSPQAGGWFPITQVMVENTLRARGAIPVATSACNLIVEVTMVEGYQLVVVNLRAINRSSGEVRVGSARTEYFYPSFYSPIWGPGDPRIKAIQSAAYTAVWTLQ